MALGILVFGDLTLEVSDGTARTNIRLVVVLHFLFEVMNVRLERIINSVRWGE